MVAGGEDEFVGEFVGVVGEFEVVADADDGDGRGEGLARVGGEEFQGAVFDRSFEGGVFGHRVGRGFYGLVHGADDEWAPRIGEGLPFTAWPVIALLWLGGGGVGDEAGVEAGFDGDEVFYRAGEAVEGDFRIGAGGSGFGAGLNLRLRFRHDGNGQGAGAGALGQLPGDLGQAFEPVDIAGAAGGGLRREA